MKARTLCALLVLFVAAFAGCKKSPTTTQAGSDASGIRITVDAEGYHPTLVTAPAGKPARLVFTRTSDEGCGQQLVFPALDIRKDLPLNQPVSIDVTMPPDGSIAFACGMDMYRGSVVAK